jgi:hypothetical protein
VESRPTASTIARPALTARSVSSSCAQGPAEVGEHAVAKELRHVALVADDLARDRVLVGAQDLAHLLGVEAGGERGRADHVDEHHRELAALGLRAARPVRGGARRRRWRGPRVGRPGQGGDRGQEPLAVAERGDPELAQVVLGQGRQQVRVDVVVAERLLVPAQAESRVAKRRRPPLAS